MAIDLFAAYGDMSLRRRKTSLELILGVHLAANYVPRQTQQVVWAAPRSRCIEASRREHMFVSATGKVAKHPTGLDVPAVLRESRTSFLLVGVFSAFINVLTLTGAMFMLQVYDRVIPSKSLPTLLGLGIIAAGCFATQGFLDIIRGRMLIRISSAFDARISVRIQQIATQFPLRVGPQADPTKPMRDLDQIRTFLSSGGPLAIFDIPWMPFYIAVCFFFHPLLGFAALFCGLLLAVVALLTEINVRGPVAAVTNTHGERLAAAQSIIRNTEAVSAMGMLGTMSERWSRKNAQYVHEQQRAHDVTSGFGALSKILRIALQSGILATGAYLVVAQQATAGMMIASSIITARALAPIEQAIAFWRSFIAARNAYKRTEKLLERFPEREPRLSLPPPTRYVSAEAISLRPPGSPRLSLIDVSFRLAAGEAMAVVGPSGAGKSSLARAVVGVWSLERGQIRLDGAPFDQWNSDEVGKSIGYLPQDVELFGGTVSQNIARFDEHASAHDVLAAANAAGIHELILRFPQGYETDIAENGLALSAGQRQRIGLARALYGNPFLVVLDEPNAHLDVEGERAVLKAIQDIKARLGIVIIVAHRTAVLDNVTTALILAEGRMVAFGPRDEVFTKQLRMPPPPTRVVPRS